MARNIFIRSKSFRNALQRAGKIASDKKSLGKLLSRTKEKVKSIEGDKGIVHKLLDKVFTFIRMIRAHISGEYKNIPLKTLILMVAGLLYFLMPLDFLPDFIPGLGLVDDVSIVLAIFKSISQDVENFEAFENSKGE